MIALLPLIGGILLGWFAPRKVAVGGQIALILIAAVMLVVSAPWHGSTYAGGALLSLAMAVVAAGSLYLGIRLGRRRVNVSSR